MRDLSTAPNTASVKHTGANSYVSRTLLVACMYELCESHTVWAWVNRALCELSMFELCAALTLVLNALFIVHDNSHHSMPCRHISKLKKNIYTVHKKSECKNVQ